MTYFCTLFDSYYLSRGLAMHESLLKNSREFHLYIFAFNDLSYSILQQLQLPNVTVISLKEFENDDLLKVKSSRSIGEYCWTCTPSTVKYCLDTYNLPHCTYIDADLYFYKDPSILLEEMQDAGSVLITEHRYTPKYDQSSTSGIYCVQFVTFKNDANGRIILQWWIDRCLEWCYARFENGKFGDQKYLDDWTTRFQGVHVLKHLGGGVAPWNVQQYTMSKKGDWQLALKEEPQKKYLLVFYHFHKMTFVNETLVDLCLGFDLNDSSVKRLYHEYALRIREINQMLSTRFGLITLKKPESSFKAKAGRIIIMIYRKIFGVNQVRIRIDRPEFV